MTIQDLAGNIFQTASTQMIGFVPISASSDERRLALRIYRFLIEGIREADQVDGQRFVERFLEGPQGVWEGIDASIRSLPDMWSIVKCNDRFLVFLKWIVGWTSELDYITDDLDSVTLRRLIATSVPFWKIRGTEEAIADILQLTTASRTRVFDWFDFRYVADVTSLGEAVEGHDAWALPLPGAPDYVERQINVRIVDNGLLNRRLVRNLCALTRPGGERIRISYLGFLDLFEVDDDASQWTVAAGPSPTVSDGAMTVAVGQNLHANPNGSDAWRNYIVSVVFTAPALAFSFYRVSDDDCYIVSVQGSQVVLYSLVGGVTLTPLATAITYAPYYPVVPSLQPNSWLATTTKNTLRVQANAEGGATRIAVWLNANVLLSVLDSTFMEGSFGFLGATVGLPMVVHDVEMRFLPFDEDFIDIQSA